MYRLRALCLFLLFLCAALPALAANRVAMVVGNNSYPNLGHDEQLQSAHNDANAMAEVLERNGFRVFLGTDLSRADFIQMLFDFTGSLQEDDIALFFYAGHGVAINGANYLLPSDIHSSSASRRLEAQRLASLSVNEQSVLSAMKQSGAAVSLAILDACRDNPLKGATGRSIGASRGLQRLETRPQGTFSIYSAGYGQIALDRLPGDGSTANSVFTRVLLDRLQRPGMTVRQLALSTRDEVRQLAAGAGHVQSPAYYDELGTAEPVLLTLPDTSAPAARSAQTTTGSSTIADQIEMMLIEEVRDSDLPEDLQAYLDTYPNGRFAALARARLTRLGRTSPGNDAASGKIAELQAALTKSAEKAQEYETALERFRKNTDVLRDDRNRLKADLATVSAQKSSLYADLQKTRAELENAQEGNTTLRMQYSAGEGRIRALGDRLNEALAQLALSERRQRETEERLAIALETVSRAPGRDFAAYRDTLISQLRKDLGSREGISVKDDRLVVASAVLFEPGSVTVSPSGALEITKFAKLLKAVVDDIPKDLNWGLRVDGHTDNVPLSGSGKFADNWELSQARALAVVKYMSEGLGIPPERLAAVGFGQYQPLDAANTRAARAKNRRIELMLVAR